MNFFTSDLHFGSNQTIKMDNRPFKNAKHFEKITLKIIKKLKNKAKAPIISLDEKTALDNKIRRMT